MCPECGTTHTRTVAGEAAWNYRAATGSSATPPPAMISTGRGAARMAPGMLIGRGAPLSSPAAVYCTHSTPRSRIPVRPALPAVVGKLLAGGALGDDGANPRVSTHRGDALLAAHRLTQRGDLAGADAGLPGLEGHRSGGVPVTPPAEVHRVPAGKPVAALPGSSG